MALGYQNLFYLKQAQKKQQSLYDGKVLLEKHDPSVVHDSEETLQLAQESHDKMKQMKKEIKPANYTKINHLSGVFVPQTALSRSDRVWAGSDRVWAGSDRVWSGSDQVWSGFGSGLTGFEPGLTGFGPGMPGTTGLWPENVMVSIVFELEETLKSYCYQKSMYNGVYLWNGVMWFQNEIGET
nr:Gag-Pol polyprotein [Tanacetum cinerariifolium]